MGWSVGYFGPVHFGPKIIKYSLMTSRYVTLDGCSSNPWMDSNPRPNPRARGTNPNPRTNPNLRSSLGFLA